MEKKSPETSKVILIIIAIVIICVIVFSLVMVAVTQDLSPLDWILGGMFSLASVSVAFYYWKARKENEIKLRVKYGVENTAGIIGVDEDETTTEEIFG